MALKSYEQQIIDERSLSSESEPEELTLAKFITAETKPSEDIDWNDKQAVEKNKQKERLQKARRQNEVATRLDISTDMLKKKLYHKDISRDWAIAICSAYGLDAYQAGEALYVCALPCFDDSVKRDRIIQSFLNEHKDQPTTLAEFNLALIAEGLTELKIQKRNRQEKEKEETFVSPYKVIGVTKVRVRDYDGDPYNSLSTEYLPNQECEAVMLLQDDSGKKHLLTAYSNGKYLFRTEHDSMPRYITVDSEPSMTTFMLHLSEVVRKRKQECDDLLHDSRNYRGRYSANIKNDSIHVFYEEYNYWIVKYEKSFFDIEKMEQGHRELYLILRDGRIDYRRYIPKKRVAIKRQIINTEASKVVEYYSQIVKCMQTATRLDQYVDDSDATLTIRHYCGDIVLPRGLHNDNDSIESITHCFLSSVEIR